MSVRLIQPGAYADLGDVWLRDQLARLTQKRAQFGGHYRIEADALLAQLANTARDAKATAALVTLKISAGDRIWRPTVAAIARSSRLDSHVAAGAIAH